MTKQIRSAPKNTQRDMQILEILEQNGPTSVHELCKRLYLSEATMRRSLSDLARRGLINRTHGGAELLKTYTRAGPFSNRMILNAAAKRDIARKAASIVPPGSIVFLDHSSTCYHLAEALMEKRDLTVVTNNLEIALLLSQTKFHVHISGGRMHQSTRMSLVGEDAHGIFEEMYADFVFFSTFSLSSDGIVSDVGRDGVNIRKAMFKHAKQKVFLCDSSKFNKTAGYIQCTLGDVDMLISEEDKSSVFADRFPGLKLL